MEQISSSEIPCLQDDFKKNKFNCVDAACFRRKYSVLFVLMKYGVKESTVRESIEKYQELNLSDESIEKILAFFSQTAPEVESFFLERELQKKTFQGNFERDPEGMSSDSMKYGTILGSFTDKEFEEIAIHYRN